MPGFDPVPQPVTDLGILDVHELEPDAVAVSAIEEFDHLAEGHALCATEELRLDLPVEVGLGESEGVKGKTFIAGRLFAEWVEPCLAVAKNPVVIDHADDASAPSEIQFLGRSLAGVIGRMGAVSPDFEAFEERRPHGIDGPGIALPKGVGFVEEIGVQPGGHGGVHWRSGSKIYR